MNRTNRNIPEETNTGLFESDYRAPGVPRHKDNQDPTKCLQLRPRQFALTWGKSAFYFAARRNSRGLIPQTR
jgi:hypothetical protein